MRAIARKDKGWYPYTMRVSSRLLMVISVALTGLLVVCLWGCEKKPVALEVAPARVSDAASLFERVRKNVSGVDRMDAALEVRIQGTPVPYRGRFYGTASMESNDDEFALRLQIYTVLGVPVLEAIAKGSRVEVFSPLDHTVFVNFTEIISDKSPEEFPLSSFDEVALPLSLIKDQIQLIWGLGLSDRYGYEFSDTGESFVISERDGDYLLREMEYSKSDLHLERVRMYQGGIMVGGMECGEYGQDDASSGFFPRSVLLHQNRIRVTLKFSKFRVNREIKGPKIEFRDPDQERLILLTPPVP